jgi:hypothetical protein
MDKLAFFELAFAQYVETELWSQLEYPEDPDSDPEPYDAWATADDLTRTAVRSLEEDMWNFVSENWLLIRRLDPGQVGHDFALTRNRHGAGFWDRGYGKLGDVLTDRSHTYGEIDLYTEIDANGRSRVAVS